VAQSFRLDPIQPTATIGYYPFKGMRPMNDFELPVIRYALSDDVSIAYQAMGDGPIDLIMVPGLYDDRD
jgi:hypothetical protein